MTEASPRLWADERRLWMLSLYSMSCWMCFPLGVWRKVATRELEWLCAAFFSVTSGSRAATLTLTLAASWERLFVISNLKWCINGCFHYQQHFTNGSNIVLAEIQTEAPEFHKTIRKGRKSVTSKIKLKSMHVNITKIESIQAAKIKPRNNDIGSSEM